MKIKLCILFLSAATITKAANVFEKPSAYDIYGLFERTKIAAFSTDSFRRSGVDQNNVSSWNTFSDSANQFALQNAAPANKSALTTYITNLNNIRAYIEKTISDLKAGSVSTSIAEAQQYASVANGIEKEALAKLKSVTQPDNSWLSRIPTGSIILNPVNLKTFTDYAKILDQAKRTNAPIRDFEITGILKLNNITTTAQIGNLVNNLEQYNYKTPDDRAKQFLEDLSRVYPKILSIYVLSIVSNTKNKPYMIIFAQAGAYSNILQQIIRELGQ